MNFKCPVCGMRITHQSWCPNNPDKPSGPPGPLSGMLGKDDDDDDRLSGLPEPPPKVPSILDEDEPDYFKDKLDLSKPYITHLPDPNIEPSYIKQQTGLPGVFSGINTSFSSPSGVVRSFAKEDADTGIRFANNGRITDKFGGTIGRLEGDRILDLEGNQIGQLRDDGRIISGHPDFKSTYLDVGNMPWHKVPKCES